MPVEDAKSRGLRWLGRGFWAVMDQGLFASSNFLLSVLLARWLSAQEYGAFTVAYAAFWLVGTLHNALLTEPMLIFGSSKHKHRPSEYMGSLLYMHLGVSILASLPLLAVGAVAWFAGWGASSSAFLAMGIVAPLVLFQWLMRRACYMTSRLYLAASGGALYMVMMIAVAYVFYRGDWLSPVTAFSLMGAASLLAGIWLIARLGATRPPTTDGGSVRDVAKDHWGYGRWALPASLLAWVPMNGYYVLLPVWADLEASAALRALTNLIMPVTQGILALSVLLLPALVRARDDGGFGRLVGTALVLFTSCTAVYMIVLGVFHRPLVSWLYAGKYDEYASLLWFVGALPIVIALGNVLGAALRALEQPDRMFWAYALSAAVTVTVGSVLMVSAGVAGAIIGMMVSFLTSVGIMIWLLTTQPRKPLPSGPS